MALVNFKDPVSMASSCLIRISDSENFLNLILGFHLLIVYDSKLAGKNANFETIEFGIPTTKSVKLSILKCSNIR